MATEASKKFTPYQIFLIALLTLLQFVVVLDFMIIAPLGDVMMKSLNIKPAQFSLVMSSYAFSAATAGILAAGFADRFDRKGILLFVITGFTLGTFLCVIANAYMPLLFARIVTGLFAGIISAICLTIVADSFSPQQHGRTMSFIQMAFAASQVLGIPIGIVLAHHFNWHFTFLAIVALSILALAAILVKLRPINEHLKDKTDLNFLLHLWHTLSNDSYQSGFVAIALLSVGGFMLMPFVSSYLINNVGITGNGLSLVFMLTGVASILIVPFIGRLSDKIGKYSIFAAGSVVTIIALTIFTNLGNVPLWQVILTNILVMVGMMGQMIPVQSLNTLLPEPSARGAYMSLTESVKQIAGGVGATVAGLVVKQQTKTSPVIHFDTLGYLICLIIIASFFFVRRINGIVNNKSLW